MTEVVLRPFRRPARVRRRRWAEDGYLGPHDAALAVTTDGVVADMASWEAADPRAAASNSD